MKKYGYKLKVSFLVFLLIAIIVIGGFIGSLIYDVNKSPNLATKLQAPSQSIVENLASYPKLVYFNKQQDDFSKLIRETAKCIFAVQIDETMQTGVAIGVDGYILTKYIESDIESVTIIDNNGNKLSSQVFWSDADFNLSILKCEKPLPYLSMSKLNDCKLMESIALISIDANFGFEHFAKIGELSSLNKSVYSRLKTSNIIKQNLFEISGVIQQEGVVLDLFGKVVGFNCLFDEEYVLIPCEYFSDILKFVQQDEHYLTPQLDIIAYNAFYANYIGDTDRHDGVYIKEVIEGGACEKAGIKSGDVIIKFVENDIYSMQDLILALFEYKSYTEVKITIISDKKEESKMVALSTLYTLDNEELIK